MIHQRQRLALGFEARDNLPGVHPELDDLQRDSAPDRLLLLGEINSAKASFTDDLKQFVWADQALRGETGFIVGRWVERWSAKESAGAILRAKQLVDSAAQLNVTRA